MNLKIQILFFLSDIHVTGCGALLGEISMAPQRSIVYKSSPSKLNYLVIRTITNDRCYYTDAYAEKYENGRKIYELSYGCSKYTKAGKTIYIFDTTGILIKQINYSFAEPGDSTLSLDETDVLVIHLIDSIRSKQTDDYPGCKICFTPINALRVRRS